MSEELKPCPFCGCEQVVSVPVTNGNAMKCEECEAVGPRTIFRGDEAAIYWNDRPAPASQPVALVELRLGGIDDSGEYEPWDLQAHGNAIDALQERLVVDGKPVFVPLYAAPIAASQPVAQVPDAEQEHLYDDSHRQYARGFNACRDLWLRSAAAPAPATVAAEAVAQEWECCGNPVVGAEYMGSQEMVCCGNYEPAGEPVAQGGGVDERAASQPSKGDN